LEVEPPQANTLAPARNNAILGLIFIGSPLNADASGPVTLAV
jgi:hypothetical protein